MKPMGKGPTTIIMAFLVAVCMGFSAHSAERVRIAASNNLLADLVKAVGGGRVAVTPIVASSNCVHSYEPTPANMRLVAGSSLYIKEGLGDDEWADRMLRNVGSKGIIVVVAAKGLTAGHGHGPDEKGHEAEESGSHAYFDLGVMAKMADRIAAGLADADPGSKGYYAANAKAYKARLASLKEWTRKQVAPYAKVRVISYSRALEGFLESVGIEPVLVVEDAHEGEVSPKAMAEAVSIAKRGKVKAILGDSGLPGTAKAIADESGTILILLNPGLGKGRTFPDMYRDNVNALVKGLK